MEVFPQPMMNRMWVKPSGCLEGVFKGVEGTGDTVMMNDDNGNWNGAKRTVL